MDVTRCSGRRSRLLILTAFLFAPALLAGPAFTIDQVLSAPFPDDLVASPKGDAVAWVANAAGVRNIQVATSPAWTAAPVTRFTTDDGQDLDEIAWKPDSSGLIFTRGGGANRHGEFPNPRSDPAGVHQEIWMASLSRAPVKLADGHSPAVSPDGSTIVWILDGQVWSMPFGGHPAQWIHARGSARELRWSSDGTRLAFTSDRGDHALIAIFDVRGKSLRFLDPSADTDQSPVWSPDGKQVAFIRLPASPGDFEFGPKRSGPPWSIRISDASSGKGREVWRAQEGRGSVFWPMQAENQLLWMTDDQLVFPWERDGWLHLYAFGLANRMVRPLTQGEFEIEYAAAARDRKSVIFSSNQDDPDRRHLWRVSLDGGPPQRLTPGNGIEWSPAPLNNGRVAVLHSDAKVPARAALLDAGTVRELAPSAIRGEFPSASLVEPQPVVITSKDGMRLHAQLFLPPSDDSGKHPAVVFFHGGSRRQMLLGWHYMPYYSQTYGFNQYLASRGYVVLSVNYRSGIGYGEEFRESPNFGATGASEFNDVLAAGELLRARADVDPRKIGVWGGSYGGYLTALALARASDLFAAGVDLHGVHDWNLEITKAAPARDADKRSQIERVAFESSPMASISTWRSPVLLIQGDDDRTVAFAQMVQLVEALRKQGVPFEQVVFPDEVHEFLLHEDWLRAFHAADEFLARYLKP
ncbi:MAG TPA: alpha/beta fold hydrolase [Bryobacteraceae bacterium]|nr:alpha/beta fold hydrolase [Bryobacteraceae bacterium]